MNKRQVNGHPLDAIPADFFDTLPRHDGEPQAMRLEYIPVDFIQPDFHQARRLMPAHIHDQLRNGAINKSQAMITYFDHVLEQLRFLGHPIRSVLDLLPDAEWGRDLDTIGLPADACNLRDLLVLAVSIVEDGLINPLTLIDISTGPAPLYMVETGERRLWAGVAISLLWPPEDGSVMLLSRIISREQASAARQAHENLQRSDLNAIGRMRQAALLILDVNGVDIRNQPLNNDLYRKALNFDFKRKDLHDEVKSVLNSMGGISLTRLSRIKSLLNLTDAAIEYGDRHNTPARILERLVQLPPEQQDVIIQDAVMGDWNTKRLAAEIEEYHLINTQNAADESEQPDYGPERAMVNKIRRSYGLNTQKVAEELKRTEGTYSAACVRLNEMRTLLDAVERALEDLETQTGVEHE